MRLVSAFILVLVPAIAQGASIVKATYTIDGNAIAMATYTGEDGGPESDPVPYWNLLRNAPQRAYDVTIKPDQKGGTTATMKGKISISVTIRNKFSMGTVTTESLTLVRDDADSDRWYLPAEELKRIKALLRDSREEKPAETPAINLWVDLGLGLIGEEEAKETMKSLDADFKSTLKSETEALTGDLYGVRQVSGKQFAALVDEIDLVSSFTKTTVIGKTQERGYLEVKIALTSSHGYVAIVCAPLDDLPESTRIKL